MKRKVIIHLLRKKKLSKKPILFPWICTWTYAYLGVRNIFFFFSGNYEYVRDIQLIFTYPKSIIEILQKGVKCVQCER